MSDRPEFMCKCMNVQIKVIAHWQWNFREADLEMREFCKEHSDEIIRTNRHDNFRVDLRNGEIHYFVPSCVWDRWTKGRTYLHNGKLYHSDYPVKGEE